jgi:hypothetical protein
MDSYNGLNSPTDWIMGEYNVALMYTKEIYEVSLFVLE